jgi:hypothetical protein
LHTPRDADAGFLPNLHHAYGTMAVGQAVFGSFTVSMQSKGLMDR